MGNAIITLGDAVRQIEMTGDMGIPIPFSAKWVRADRRKDTGGQIVEAKGIVLLRNNKGLSKTMRSAAGTRDRNSNTNATRDVWYDGREDCIHIFLMVEFNGKTVL